MADFASAAMLRVLDSGMRTLRLHPPTLPPAQGARVRLLDKREVVAEALRQGGWGCLAQLGCGLHAHERDPTHQALTAARGATELMQRWQRLERYLHSRHRVRVLQDDGASLRLEHHSLLPGQPPQPAESLVVLGLLAALLQAVGAVQVQAWAGGAPVLPAHDDAALARAVQAGQTARWLLRWQAWQPAPTPLPAPHAVAPALPSGGPPLLQAVSRLLVQDLTHSWPVPQVARGLGHSTRAYQRALATAGFSHTGLLAQLRCRAAAWWLVHSGLPVAEVGFLCGYTDQPHFTRRFKTQVGLPPGQYRQAFAVG